MRRRKIHDVDAKRVGINTTSPGRPLHVVGTTRMEENAKCLELVGTDHVYIEFYPRGMAEGRAGYFGYSGPNVNYIDLMNQLASSIRFGTNNTTRLLITADGHLLPYTDNAYNCGDDTHRWALVRAVTVTQGDIGFGPEDQPCPICGKKFEVGDVVVLKVHKVLESGEFRARPIHLKCAG